MPANQDERPFRQLPSDSRPSRCVQASADFPEARWQYTSFASLRIHARIVICKSKVSTCSRPEVLASFQQSPKPIHRVAQRVRVPLQLSEQKPLCHNRRCKSRSYGQNHRTRTSFCATIVGGRPVVVSAKAHSLIRHETPQTVAISFTGQNQLSARIVWTLTSRFPDEF